MSAPICIRLPYLRHSLFKKLERTAGCVIRNASRLWPGLPAEEMEIGPYWTPTNYPFGEQAAKACIREFALLKLADLESMCLVLNGVGMESQAARLEEMAALSSFARNGEGHEKAAERTKIRLALEQAQKTLFWVWLQEGRLCEIAGLERRYAAVCGYLASSFAESARDHSGTGILRVMPDGVTSQFPDSSLLPSWRIRALNAALFIPLDMPVFVEGEMAGDLCEALDFSPAPDLAARLGVAGDGQLHASRAPLWLVTGAGKARSHGDGDFLSSLYNGERTWLLWREND